MGANVFIAQDKNFCQIERIFIQCLIWITQNRNTDSHGLDKYYQKPNKCTIYLVMLRLQEKTSQLVRRKTIVKVEVNRELRLCHAKTKSQSLCFPLKQYWFNQALAVMPLLSLTITEALGSPGCPPTYALSRLLLIVIGSDQCYTSLIPAC